MLIINAAEVRHLLPMEECIDAVETAMIAASSGEVVMPPRLFSPLFDNSGFLGLMPGSASHPAVYGAKLVSLHPANPAKGLPAIQGFVVLFDHATGTPVALIEGAEVTAMRTAAASGLATKLLSRPEARSHGIMGAGVQAITHIDAVNAVRPIDKIVIWGRSLEKAEALAAAETKRTGRAVRASADPRDIAACDIISCVTGSATPILKGEWLAPGAHVNLVGSHTPNAREADSMLMKSAAIYVDLMAAALKEAGDILIPIGEGLFTQDHIIGEIGMLAMKKIPGRTTSDQITVYKSLGIVAQDLYAASLVYRKARQRNAGVEVPL